MPVAETSLLAEFFDSFVEILVGGGILMVPLTILAIAIYGYAARMFFFFRQHRFYRSGRESLERALLNPDQASGELGEILAYTNPAEVLTAEELQNRFTEVRGYYLADVDARRGFLLTLVTVAPLMGLLGTVMGMLTTFAGLAIASGGQTVDQIAAGISEALITTQTGLMIAIPAYVFISYLQKHRNQMESYLTALETLSTQLFRKHGAKRA